MGVILSSEWADMTVSPQDPDFLELPQSSPPLPLVEADASKILKNGILESSAKKTRGDYERIKGRYEKFRGSEAHSSDLVYRFILDEGRNKAPTTLWSSLTHLTKYLRLECNVEIDRKLINEWLKKESQKHTKKKAPSFTREQVFAWLDQTPNEPCYLARKLFIIFSYYGAMRLSEAKSLTWDSISQEPEGLRVSFFREKTRTSSSPLIPLSSLPSRNSLIIYLDYKSQAQSKAVNGNFWVKYDEKLNKFVNSTIGIHILATWTQLLAKDLGLPNWQDYTSHSMRVTSATVLADSGASSTNLKRHGGWASESMAESYVRQSKAAKLEVANMLSGQFSNSPISTTTSSSLSSSSSFTNCTFNNCTFPSERK